MVSSLAGYRGFTKYDFVKLWQVFSARVGFRCRRGLGWAESSKSPDFVV